jgi:hypothetical protein
MFAIALDVFVFQRALSFTTMFCLWVVVRTEGGAVLISFVQHHLLSLFTSHSLQRNSIGAEGAKALAAVLRTNTNLIRLV